jgi:hypothetical protein
VLRSEALAAPVQLVHAVRWGFTIQGEANRPMRGRVERSKDRGVKGIIAFLFTGDKYFITCSVLFTCSDYFQNKLAMINKKKMDRVFY